MSASAASASPAPVANPASPVTPVETATQAVIEQPDKFELRDLAAQETMANWAMWMGIAALLTFVVTSAGTLLIWRQVKSTKDAIKEAAAGTEAMREANAISREMGEAQSRCYLSAKDAKFCINQHGNPSIGMTVLNSGQSPARNFG